MIRWRSNRYDNLRDYKGEMGTSGPAKRRSSRKVVDAERTLKCANCGFPKWQHETFGLIPERVCRNFKCEAEGT